MKQQRTAVADPARRTQHACARSIRSSLCRSVQQLSAGLAVLATRPPPAIRDTPARPTDRSTGTQIGVALCRAAGRPCRSPCSSNAACCTALKLPVTLRLGTWLVVCWVFVQGHLLLLMRPASTAAGLEMSAVPPRRSCPYRHLSRHVYGLLAFECRYACVHRIRHVMGAHTQSLCGHVVACDVL
jgi:hypothetical protein